MSQCFTSAWRFLCELAIPTKALGQNMLIGIKNGVGNLGKFQTIIYIYIYIYIYIDILNRSKLCYMTNMSVEEFK